MERIIDMFGFIVLAAATGGTLWYLGIWPFDRSYPFLIKYSDRRNKNSVAPAPQTNKPPV
jgi:hypothetical protein